MTSRRNDIEDIIPQEEDTLGKTFSRRGSISAVMNLGNRSLAPNVCHPQYLENFREHFSSIFLVSLAKHLWLCCKLKQENADFFVPHITFQQTTLAPHLWNHEVRYPLYHTHTHTSNRGHGTGPVACGHGDPKWSPQESSMVSQRVEQIYERVTGAALAEVWKGIGWRIISGLYVVNNHG